MYMDYRHNWARWKRSTIQFKPLPSAIILSLSAIITVWISLDYSIRTLRGVWVVHGLDSCSADKLTENTKPRSWGNTTAVNT